MPVLARETEAFGVLAFATSSTLGGRKIETKPNPSLDTFEALARYLPESAKRIPAVDGTDHSRITYPAFRDAGV